MKYVLLNFLAVGVLAGCATAPPQTTAPSQPPPASTVPDTPAGRAARAVDAIIYSEASKEDRLEQLKPYAALMDTKKDIEAKSDLELGLCLIGGPGVESCSTMHSGLQLIFDQKGKLRVIRRAARMSGGIPHPEMSLSQPGFEEDGYARWYPN